jgi:transcriptional regulator with XRE-family HTH domain
MAVFWIKTGCVVNVRIWSDGPEGVALNSLFALLFDLPQILEVAIRRLRKQRGWSQEALGAKAELHRTYIGARERAEENMTLQTLDKLAVASLLTNRPRMAAMKSRICTKSLRCADNRLRPRRPLRGARSRRPERTASKRGCLSAANAMRPRLDTVIIGHRDSANSLYGDTSMP